MPVGFGELPSETEQEAENFSFDRRDGQDVGGDEARTEEEEVEKNFQAKVRAISAENPDMTGVEVEKLARWEAENGVLHKPLKVEGDPEVARRRKEEMERVKNGETVEVSLESKEGQNLLAAIRRVAEVMNGLGLKWKLDGALNISLRDMAQGNPAFFRQHRDVDVHVRGQVDGELLSRTLAGHRTEDAPYGYGAFSDDQKLNQPEQMAGRGYLATQMVSGELPEWGLRIFRLDSEGNPVIGVEDAVIDVHASQGPLASRFTHEVLPDKWQRQDEVDLGGVKIGLDHVGSVLYNKLATGRYRDDLDIDVMVDRGQLKSEDISDVQELVEKELGSEKLHADQRETLLHAQEKLRELGSRLED